MAKNEVGEFELVLGNKQLLSVFFIVVALLGLFFTMGYIVGTNSGAGGVELANRKRDAKPTIVDSPGASSQPAAAAPEPAASKPEKQEEPVAPAPTHTAVDEPKAEAKKPVEEPKPDKKDDKKSKKEKPPVEPPAPAPVHSGAIAGTYLQLAAVPKTEADLLISVLRKKGFSAAAGPGPEGSNLFRVLVGPLSGADAISQTRASLNDAGMQGSKALVRKF
jgi:cell division septation protein DedD